MRPNVAQDVPPMSIDVGGFSYNCETDFRTWLEVLRLMKNIKPSVKSIDDVVEQEQLMIQIETLIFGGYLQDEPFDSVFEGIAKFISGYPSAPVRGGSSERTFSFEYDLNEIIMAIWTQFGINLTAESGVKCHWWMFMLYFRTLCGDHYILNLMQMRGYNGKDKELRKKKSQVSLPVEYTQEEQEAIDEFNAMFEPKEGKE